jgi:hypothetical protein
MPWGELFSNILKPSAPWDLLFGTCGPDVTIAVNRTLDQIASVYEKWSFWEKCRACIALHTRPGDGWDIIPLKELGTGDFDKWPEIKGRAMKDRNVQVVGRCYNGGSVNFVMWGKANQLCYNTFKSEIYSPLVALAVADTWKTVMYDGAERDDALLFVAIGYGGALSSLPYHIGYDDPINLCVQPFEWTWKPYK